MSAEAGADLGADFIALYDNALDRDASAVIVKRRRPVPPCGRAAPATRRRAR